MCLWYLTISDTLAHPLTVRMTSDVRTAESRVITGWFLRVSPDPAFYVSTFAGMSPSAR